MRKTEKNNRFVRELEEVNRNSSPVVIEMLRELDLIIKQIESIPSLSQTEPVASEEERSRQPVPLRLVRRCLGQSA